MRTRMMMTMIVAVAVVNGTTRKQVAHKIAQVRTKVN